MKRNVDINDISDGRLYSSGDMVKADCHDCEGCSDCCHGMGSSIVLDPMDVWRLQRGTGYDFQGLLDQALELQVVDRMILPNLRMTGEEEACPFLNEAGRCKVHPYRPGICRMFPLGRYYEEDRFQYFLQIHECSKKERGKVKIKKWLGIENQKEYEAYIWNWHSFLKQCEEGMETLDEQNQKVLTVLVLRRFYQESFQAVDDQEFYKEFADRMAQMKELLGF